jgi:hypothetical protein
MLPSRDGSMKAGEQLIWSRIEQDECRLIISSSARRDVIRALAFIQTPLRRTNTVPTGTSCASRSWRLEGGYRSTGPYRKEFAMRSLGFICAACGEL